MAHLENGSRAARAIIAANARKFLQGENIGFGGLLGAAFRDGITEPKAVARICRVSPTTARNWTAKGREPNRKTQKLVVELILAEPT